MYDNVLYHMNGGDMWGTVPDWISAVASLAVAGAAVVAAWQGVKSLTSWKAEALGRRRAELAEEVLADFYEGRDVLKASRSPASWSGEGDTRTRGDSETPAEVSLLNAYFAPVERLQRRSDFLSQMQARKYRFVAHFGESAGIPYDEFFGAYNKIVIASQMLIMVHRGGRRPTDYKSIERWEQQVWWTAPDTDVVSKEVDHSVQAIEAICRPIITSSIPVGD